MTFFILVQHEGEEMMTDFDNFEGGRGGTRKNCVFYMSKAFLT